MSATIEIRYESLLDLVRQMPPAEMERLLADLRRMIDAQRKKTNGSEIKYRPEVVEAMKDLEAGRGIKMTLDEVKELLGV